MRARSAASACVSRRPRTSRPPSPPRVHRASRRSCISRSIRRRSRQWRASPPSAKTRWPASSGLAETRMADLVLIAGGGIGGLATALTLQQIGVPCVVFEAVREMRPLGVGINMQPNAVRELYDLGIGAAELDRVGLPAREWALVGLNGKIGRASCRER